MVPRIATFLVGAASALLLTASFAAAQTAAGAPAPGASVAAPADDAASRDAASPGREGRRARGEGRGEGRAAMGACRADMKSLCGTIERGKGRKLACLIENRAKASPECQTAITVVEARRAGLGADKAASRAEGGGRGGKGKMAVCRADSKALCADVERGGGRKVACLKTNEAKLSPDCAAVVKGLPVGKG